MTFDPTFFRDRVRLYRALRGVLESHGFLEVETPLLTSDPIPESTISLFRTEFTAPDGSKECLHLVPSPEVWMKRLLARGAPAIYQISRCFRNEEGPWHLREFTMLEWYEPGAGTAESLELMCRLLEASALSVPLPGDLRPPPRIMRMEEAFQEYAGFSLEADLNVAGLAEPRPGPETLRSAGRILSSRLTERGLGHGENDSPADLFHRLFVTLVEEFLPIDRPLILSDWPSLIPTLARRKPNSPWAERWELYLRGVEIANCYEEENNLDALKAYWESESQRQNGVPISSDWPRLVAAGMPFCSGTAVGLDRLLALLRGEQDLGSRDRGMPLEPPSHR